jgi:DNA-binding MarR family transcriptional regulator
MMLLYRVDEIPQNPCVLADKAGVTHAIKTGLLDGLERVAYIARETAPDDLRKLEVKLTAEGRKFLERVMPDYFRLIRRCMAGLSTSEKEQLIALLTKLGATADLPQPILRDSANPMAAAESK